MAYKFIKTKDENNKFELSDVELVIDHNDVTTTQLLSEFEMFLKGCGFHFDGVIMIVNEEEE